jgi:hypothetical protein
MPKALFVRDAQLERLRQNITPNARRYATEKPWLGDYFGNAAWYLQSSVEMPNDVVLKPPASKTELFDLENTKLLYSALRHLTPIQAADERLWVYLSHVTYWDYMRQRWAVEQYEGKPRFAQIVQERYFFMADRPRALIRNGIARLWWYGYTTYDERRDDPFELTAVLLYNLDVTQSILERAFSRNRTVTHAALSILLQREKDGIPFYARDRVRDLAKYLVQLGGVTIIDALTSEDVCDIVSRKVDQLAPKPRLEATPALTG